MTEELKQKAKKWVKENACDWCVNADECGQGCIDCHGISGYIAGTTEATKELQEENEQLKKLIADSRKDGISPINALIIKNLLEQIEKMKCCYNCKHSRTECEHCRTDKHEKWEIK